MKNQNDKSDTRTASVFLTPKQLANRWQCSQIKLRRMRLAGNLRVCYIGRSVRYHVADVQRIEIEGAV